MSVPDFEEADLVVVGFGGAGAATAIAAADHGASVIILEKQPADRHTPSTSMSGGIVMGVNDVERAAAYMDHCSGGMIPPAVSRAWAVMAADLVGWLDRIGADLALVKAGEGENTQFEGADAVEAWTQSRPPADEVTVRDLSAPPTTGALASGMNTGEAGRRTGAEYFDSLRRVVASRERITVRYGSPAVRLIQDETGRVTGVLAGGDGDGPAREVRARRGVVLTCGGYEWNDEIKINALKASPMYFYGNPGNTGDGIRMAQAVGADLWHMNQMIGRAIGHFEEDGQDYNFVIGIHPPGYLITDKYGRRFANEVSQAQMKHSFYYELLKYDADKQEYPRNPCYWVFDERRLRAAPLVSLRSGFVRAGYYDWSPDNSREVAKGWIKQADNITELGKLAGIADPAGLQETVQRYNAGCASGADEFGRPPETLVPLDSPPYYCVPMFPGGPNTCGGPRKDERARVLDAFGAPIPGLYAAGELGEAVGLLYPANGANLSESICFGRIAAADALGVDALLSGRRAAGVPVFEDVARRLVDHVDALDAVERRGADGVQHYFPAHAEGPGEQDVVPDARRGAADHVVVQQGGGHDLLGQLADAVLEALPVGLEQVGPAGGQELHVRRDLAGRRFVPPQNRAELVRRHPRRAEVQAGTERAGIGRPAVREPGRLVRGQPGVAVQGPGHGLQARRAHDQEADRDPLEDLGLGQPHPLAGVYEVADADVVADHRVEGEEAEDEHPALGLVVARRGDVGVMPVPLERGRVLLEQVVQAAVGVAEGRGVERAELVTLLPGNGRDVGQVEAAIDLGHGCLLVPCSLIS